MLTFPPPDDPPSSGEVFPQGRAPIVRSTDSGDNEMVALTFGLVPSWARGPDAVKNLFNVRSETVRKKFGKLFRERRCVVPVESFTHWGPRPDKEPGVKKAPNKPMYEIGVEARGALTLLAGVWTGYRSGPPYTFGILTTEPGTDEMRDIHRRMPVILDEVQARTWLDEEADHDKLETFTQPWVGPLWWRRFDRAPAFCLGADDVVHV